MLFNSIAQVQLLKKLTFHWFQAWDGGTPIQFGWECAAGFAKVLSFTGANFASFVTRYHRTLSIFCYYNNNYLSA